MFAILKLIIALQVIIEGIQTIVLKQLQGNTLPEAQQLRDQLTAEFDTASVSCPFAIDIG